MPSLTLEKRESVAAQSTLPMMMKEPSTFKDYPSSNATPSFKVPEPFNFDGLSQLS